MTKVIGVRFKAGGKVYYFDPGGLEIEKDDYVIVETSRGTEMCIRDSLWPGGGPGRGAARGLL